MVTAVDLGATVSVASAVIGALVAVFGLVGYQNRRARLSTIRTAFDDVVGALASGDTERQLSGAILLRRFFDGRSELGIRDLFGRRRTPYSGEAVSVMAAVLRGMPAGDLQKLLADGLAYAPTLEHADLQRTNLQGAYLSPRSDHGSLSRADFYRADLSGASLKAARAGEAVFYRARLRSTVFSGADLRGANFFEADLTDAVFTAALLEGATFTQARNVPVEVAELIDADGRYTSASPAPPPSRSDAGSRTIFLSLPADRTPTQLAACDRIEALVQRRDCATETLTRRDYPPSDAMSEIYRRLTGCVGVIVFGLRPARSGPHGAGATPWTHLEAGMAYGCNLPMLVVREPGVETGAFDTAVAGHRVHILDLSDTWDDDVVDQVMTPWLAQLGGG